MYFQELVAEDVCFCLTAPSTNDILDILFSVRTDTCTSNVVFSPFFSLIFTFPFFARRATVKFICVISDFFPQMRQMRN